MTTDTMLRCALGVGDRTLSDFRSDGLGEREMERLRTHIAECVVCQTRLDAFEAMTQALRAQPEPNNHARLWRSVRASIAAETLSASARQRRHAHARPHAHSTRFWAAFGSIAAVVALSVGFVALFVSHGGWPPAATRVRATPTTNPSGGLTWKRIVVPHGFPDVAQHEKGDALAYTDAQVAPSDGKTAYACQADKKYVTSPVVWATHDAGSSWSVITPTNLPANTGGCLLKVDINDSNTVTVSFIPVGASSQRELLDLWTTYATFDGGATWSKPASLQDGNANYQLATARGKVYATRGTATPDGHVHIGLYVSSDQMRTWTQIDSTLSGTRPDPSQDRYTFQFWVNASTDEVLNLMVPGSLWSTRDDGAHWIEIAYPDGVYSGAPHSPLLMVGPPTTSGFLTICGAFTPIGLENEQWLECTTNDGKTWNRRPDLSITIGQRIVQLFTAGIGADGNIYASTLSTLGHGNVLLYRLPPYATSIAGWERLGELPDSQYVGGYLVAPAGNSTVFWRTPGATVVGDGAGVGSKTYTQPNYYVAMYP